MQSKGWILIAIAVFVSVSLWQAALINKTSLDLDQYSLEFNILNADDLDPVSAYARNIDLTKVPPKGSPPNLVAERATEQETSETGYIRQKHGYGGSGDKKHLGGFSTVDPEGISPFVWREMMEYFGVKTLLDVGCGRGFSTSWFYMQGVQVQCVEGSHDAIERSLLPALAKKQEDLESAQNGANLINSSNIVVQHDFSLGPWWPEETVDAVWSVELLEHVGRNFQKNYLTAFKKAALIFVTHSNWGGWHHTEVHDDVWWRSRFEMYGFVFSKDLTERVKRKAAEERNAKIPFPVPVKDGEERTYTATHVNNQILVFINPLVASMPQHAHVLSEPGCYDDAPGSHVHCGEEKNPRSRAVSSKLPDEFRFIPYKEERHKQWEEYMKASVLEDQKKEKENK